MAYDKFAAVDSSTLLFPPTVRANLAGVSPNYVINGGFDIWQRGTSFTMTSNVSQYTADRWYCNSTFSAGSSTVSQQAFTAGTAPVAGYEGTYFLRMTAGSTASWMEFTQRIEDVRTAANSVVTLSFWAKASVSTAFTPMLRQNFGSGGSSNVDTAGSNVTLTTSWARYTVNITLPSIAGKTIGSGNYLALFLYTSTPTGSQTIDLWGVQLEAGAVATPFRRNANSLQGELAACQRYYQRFSTAGALAPGNYYNTTQIMAYVSFQTKMRTAVSTTFDYSTLVARHFSGGTIGLTSPVIEANDNGVLLFATVASGTRTANDAMTLYIGSGGYLGFSAEL